MTVTPERQMSLLMAETLGDDLLRALRPHIGDRDELRRVFLHWLETLGSHDFALIAMSALRDVFFDWLTACPVEDFPSGSITITDPKEHL